MTTPDLPHFLGKASATLREIAEQRAKGWPDFSEDAFCHRCGVRNPTWWSSTAAWKIAMQSRSRVVGAEPTREPWNGRVCFACFSELFAYYYPGTQWVISPDPNSLGGKTFWSRMLLINGFH